MDDTAERIATKAELNEMDDNRLMMLKIKKWFAQTVNMEIICMLYISVLTRISLSGTSPFLFIIGMIPSLLIFFYLFRINRKDENICFKAIILHILIALYSIILSFMACSTVFSMQADSGSAAMLLAQSMFTAEPVNDAASDALESLNAIMKVIAVINLIVSVIITGLPVCMNYRACYFCRVNAELSTKKGYPTFLANHEFKNSFAKMERDKIIKQYAEAYPGSDYFRSPETVFDAMPAAAENDVQTERRDIIDRAFNNEGAGYLRNLFNNYRNQITKNPENVYDFTVLFSFVIVTCGVIRLHFSAPFVAMLEVAALMFGLLPKKVPVMYAAFVLHVLCMVGILFSGIYTASGIVGYIIINLVYITQTIFYFISCRYVKKEADDEFEAYRQRVKAEHFAELERIQREATENLKEAYYNAEHSDNNDINSEEGQIPQYSDWSKVDTGLVNSMLSDMGK